MNLRILLFLSLIATFIAGIIGASIFVFQETVATVKNEDIKRVAEDVTLMDRLMNRQLLAKEKDESQKLAEQLVALMANLKADVAQQASKPGVDGELGSGLKDVGSGVDKLKPFTDRISESLAGEIRSLEEIEDSEFDFVGETVAFLDNDAITKEESIIIAEALVGVIKARTEKEIVSARLLFQNSMAELVDRGAATQEDVDDVTELFAGYGELKEQVIIERKERGYVVVDAVRGIDGIKADLGTVQSQAAAKIEHRVAFLSQTFIIAAASFLVVMFLVGLLYMRTQIVRPIHRLEKASQSVAGGEFVRMDGPLPVAEIGSLTKNFNQMVDTLEANMHEMAEMNRGLERKVAERTREISNIINNVTAGFFIVDRNGALRPGYTASIEKILGKPCQPGMSLSLMLGLDQRAREFFVVAIDQVFEDIMPESSSLSIIPERVKVNDSVTVSLAGSCIRDANGEVEGILFTMDDISRLEEMEGVARENAAMIKILSQKDAFAQFIQDFRAGVAEAHTLVGKTGAALDRLKAILHTIKGNSGVFELFALRDLVHEIEEQDIIAKSHIEAIEASLRGFLDKNVEVLKLAYDQGVQSTYEISDEKIASLEAHVLGNMVELHVEEVTNRVLEWIKDIRKKSFGETIGPVEDLVQGLAERLGKKVAFELEGKDKLVDPDAFASFGNVLGHLLRNAVDHGIENPHERGDKPEQATIRMSLHHEGHQWVILIEDDGGGIRTDVLAQKAVAKGLYTESELAEFDHPRLLELVFESSLSAKNESEVTEVSGRGIGMSAVRDAILRQGGSITIASTLGNGTTFRIVLPTSSQRPRVLARSS